MKKALGRSGVTIAIATAFAVIAPGAVVAHELLDHPATGFGAESPPPAGFQSGGEGAEWELIETISTGNPHTDLDFFTQGGNCLLYTSPSPRDRTRSRMPSSA